MDDSSQLSQRLKRYVQVSSAVGGLAARLAGEKYLGISIDRASHADDLRAILGNLKGPLMKVAQILATVPDVLPDEYVQELSELQSNAPPMGRPFVKRRMSRELGPDWRQRFASFGETAAAAASLGQVHKAQLISGEVVACKLQYPDMASVVEADVTQLKMLLSVYESFNNAVQTHNMLAEVADRLQEELDYEREAKHILLYKYMLKDQHNICVPTVYPALSTQRLLTMSWCQGDKILQSKDHPLAFRNAVAKTLFLAWYTPLYRFGILHGDPHLGNYTVTPDGTLNLLDYGCIRVFPATFLDGVINLYRALQSNNREQAAYAYHIWGFTNLSQELLDTLNLWARFLYAPLMEDRVRPIQEGHSGVYGKEVADEVHRRLRELGGIAPPREFVVMDRAAVGIGSVFMHLNAELNWHQLFESLIDDFHVDTLTQRQGQALAQAGL